jgi:Tfp pilus assembly protein PilO
MTARDRIVVIALSVFGLLAGVWFLAVAPEREKVSKLDARVSAAAAQLATAETDLTNARGAQSRYTAAYSSIVRLGKAVPSAPEVPSLVYQLDQASNKKRVEFSSIVSGASGSTGSSLPTAPVAATAGFTQLPFTFVVNGGFFDLYHLFQQLDHFAERTPTGQLQISGRLLTVQSVKLAPSANSASGSAKSGNSPLSGTITATAYVLPPGQGVTGGATATAPAALTPNSSTSSPATPAVARVTP